MAYSKQNFQNGQILNAANLEKMENGIIAGQGAHNLLDNSDFRNPVNQSGKTSWADWNNYTVDRWIFRNNNVQEASVGASGMSITTGSKEIYFEQSFDKLAMQFYIGKPLTLVFSTNEGLLIKKWTVVDGSYSRDPIGNFQMTIGCLTNFWIDLVVPANKTINIYWAALYEGSYTAETLPPYVPKGKRVEMLNCGIPPQPRNLLDNSDFRIKNNIINTKGLTDYSFDSGKVFDRWRLHWTGDGRVSIKDGYIELYRKTHSTYLYQHPKDLESMIGKTYTVAAKVRYNGLIGWIDSTQRVNSGFLALNDWDIATCTFTVGSATSDIGKAGIEIATKADLSFEVQWVALYEGAYTKETLPAYLTKGKHVEMLNCNVPLAPHNLLDNSDFRNPVNQRGATSYSTAGNEYTIDRWKTQYNTGLTIENGYINVIGGWQIYQVLKNPKDGVYTFAVEARINSIGDYRPNMDLGGKKETLFDANIGEWKIYTLQYDVSSITDENISFSISARGGNSSGSISVKWAAMYKGSYDASTLPAYQPKGYAAELAECMRYYRRFINSAPAMSTAATAIEVEMPLEPPMRVVPTITINSVGSAYTPEGTKSVSGSYSATNTVNKAGYVFYTPSIGIGLPCVITGIDGYLSADL